MFTAECDQCGARNKLPASAQDEGINSGSLIVCRTCGAEVCVRLAIEPELPTAEQQQAEPASVHPAEAKDDGDDELTQVLESNLLPDAQTPAAAAAVEEGEPLTMRRAEASGSGAEEADSAPLVDLTEFAEAAPESLPPGPSDEETEPATRRERHLPMPPARALHAESGEGSVEPQSLGTPTLAALVRKTNNPPPAPVRVHAHHEELRVGHDVLVPPPGSLDDLWDARVLSLPVARAPSETDAPVASVSRPPDEPRKEPPRRSGLLGFALLVAGVAFVSGLALKNARERDAAAPVVRAATPLVEAPAVAPLPAPALATDSPLPATPNPELPPSETAAEASPPPLLAAPEQDPGKPAPAAAARAALKPPQPAPESGQSAPVADAPRSTVAPVRSATVATDAPPAEAAFDSAATSSALTAAAQRASNCKKPTDPSGVAVVTITFAPSGRVTSANISGPPFAGTQTGSCIASVLRGVRVPAYSGDFMTVKKTIQVQ